MDYEIDVHPSDLRGHFSLAEIPTDGAGQGMIVITIDMLGLDEPIAV